MSRLSILCRDRVGQGKEKLCHDRIVYVTTELAKEGKFLSRRNVIMLRQRCPTWGELMSRANILTSRQKISGHKVSMSRHSALCHDSGVSQQGRMRATKARERQRYSVAIEISLSRQTCTKAKKKKKKRTHGN